MKTGPLPAKLLVDLTPAFEGWADPVAFGIGWDGAIYAAARRSSESLTESHGIGIFPKSRLEQPTDYKVVRWEPSSLQTQIISGAALVVSHVQPFPNGVLLAGARCRWTATGVEQNAIAVDWSGREFTRLTLGDGLADLRVTRAGTIWASYFDEGVFGNYGWGGPGPEPIGAPGLVGFSKSGAIEFAYDPRSAGTDSICDAYAMNVAGERDVWLYFYTNFPIVRISDGRYRVWNLGVGGARALAARDDQVLLFGGYKNRALARKFQLGADGESRADGEFTMVDERGVPLERARACGVGDKLYFFADRRVLMVDDWASAARPSL